MDLKKWSEVEVSQSCPTLCEPMGSPWNSLGQNTGVDSVSLLQGIFPTQGSNPGLPLAGASLPAEPQGKPNMDLSSVQSLSRVWLFVTP